MTRSWASWDFATLRDNNRAPEDTCQNQQYALRVLRPRTRRSCRQTSINRTASGWESCQAALPSRVPWTAWHTCTQADLTAISKRSPATVRPPPDLKFYFVTSWVLFLEGLSGISGLAVSYFYKNTLKVDPATLTQVMSMTNIPWTCKPIYGFVSDAFPIFGYRQVVNAIHNTIITFLPACNPQHSHHCTFSRRQPPRHPRAGGDRTSS